MKTREEIEVKIDRLMDKVKKITKEFHDSNDYTETMAAVRKNEEILARISMLRWVLED